MKSTLSVSTLSALLLAASSIEAKEVVNNSWEQRFLKQQPNAAVISEGVYAVETNRGSIRTYGFGLGGMQYHLETLRTQLIASSPSDREARSQLINEIERLEERIRAADGEQTDASQSGTLCGAIDYDLSASVYPAQFWYLGSQASAGFMQWGGGPPVPGNVYISAWAEATHSFTNYDNDFGVFSPNGLSYISVDAFTSVGPTSGCMTGDAGASIDVYACGYPGYTFVTESGSSFCP